MNDAVEKDAIDVLVYGGTAAGVSAALAPARVGRRGTRWGGGSVDLPPPIHWRNEKYLPWKLRKIQYPLARSDDLQPLTVILENLGTADIYVSEVT